MSSIFPPAMPARDPLVALSVEMDALEAIDPVDDGAMDQLGEEIIARARSMIALPAETLDGALAKLHQWKRRLRPEEEHYVAEALVLSAIKDLERLIAIGRA